MRNHHVDLMSAAVLAAGLLVAVPDARAATATEKCQAAKVKAAGKKIFEKANCQEKALKKSIAIDQACLQRAEEKFTKAIAKADSIGTCSGTASGIEADVDTCVADLLDDILPPATTTTTTSSTTTTTEGQEVSRCCAFSEPQGFCTWVGSTACTQNAGTPGAPGSVCNPGNGECVPEIQGPGNCCTITDGITSQCFAGPAINVSLCTVLAGTSTGTLSTGVCPGVGACVP